MMDGCHVAGSLVASASLVRAHTPLAAAIAPLQ